MSNFLTSYVNWANLENTENEQIDLTLDLEKAKRAQPEAPHTQIKLL